MCSKFIFVVVYSNAKCIIHLDSKEIINCILNIKVGLCRDNILLRVDWDKYFGKPNLIFKSVERGLNVGVDDFTKQGRLRRYLIQGWC